MRSWLQFRQPPAFNQQPQQQFQSAPGFQQRHHQAPQRPQEGAQHPSQQAPNGGFGGFAQAPGSHGHHAQAPGSHGHHAQPSPDFINQFSSYVTGNMRRGGWREGMRVTRWWLDAGTRWLDSR